MIPLPNAHTVTAVSDWVECELCLGQKPLSKHALSALIEKEGIGDTSEHFFDTVWSELILRLKLYGQTLYEVEERTIKPNVTLDARPDYAACLLMALFGGDIKGSTVLFEKITSVAVAEYLGGSSERFGWPVKGGKKNIELRLADIAAKMGESIGQAPQKKYKDRGVDVISWLPFACKRSSQVVLLVQCTVQQNWKAKTMDLPMKSWEQYIHWGCNPQAAFSIPFVISSNDWHDVSKEAGILFDRLRLVRILSTVKLKTPLRAELRDWVTKGLVQLS